MPRIGPFSRSPSGFTRRSHTFSFGLDPTTADAGLLNRENASYQRSCLTGRTGRGLMPAGSATATVRANAPRSPATIPRFWHRSMPIGSAPMTSAQQDRPTENGSRSATKLRAVMRLSTLLLLAGLTVAMQSPPPSIAQSAPAQRATEIDRYGEQIAEASQRFGIPQSWIRAVMLVESNANPRARSSAGAQGLMQIMPKTWAALRTRHGLGSDPYNPRNNILAGAAYLRELHDRYGSPGFLAAYNAGPGRYEASLNGRPLPAETLAYVAALAPKIGAGAAAEIGIVGPADPAAWTHGSLFIVQSRRTTTVEPTQPEQLPPGASTAASVRDLTAIEPRSTGLFIAPAGPGDVR